MSLKVVFDNILIKLVEDDSQIIVSDDIHTPVKGEVVSMGEGTPGRPMQVRPYMTVYFYKTDAQRLNYDGDEYFVLSQRDIIAYEED